MKTEELIKKQLKNIRLAKIYSFIGIIISSMFLIFNFNSALIFMGSIFYINTFAIMLIIFFATEVILSTIYKTYRSIKNSGLKVTI